jgi:stress-induced morphogen
LANQIQYELIDLYNRERSLVEMDIKPEIKQELIEFYQGFEESIVEVSEEVYVEEETKKQPQKKSLMKILKTSNPKVMKQSTSPSTFKVDKDAGLSVSWIDGMKHYQCEFCKKDFPTRSRLKTHRQIHTQERNYMCQVSNS